MLSDYGDSRLVIKHYQKLFSFYFKKSFKKSFIIRNNDYFYAMNKITFTSGTMSNDGNEYYTLVLFNGEKKVYAANLERLEAAQVMNDYDNIKMI